MGETPDKLPIAPKPEETEKAPSKSFASKISPEKELGQRVLEGIQDLQNRTPNANFEELFTQIQNSPELLNKLDAIIWDLGLLSNNPNEPVLSDIGAKRFNALITDMKGAQIIDYFAKTLATINELEDFGVQPHISAIAYQGARDFRTIDLKLNYASGTGQFIVAQDEGQPSEYAIFSSTKNKPKPSTKPSPKPTNTERDTEEDTGKTEDTGDDEDTGNEAPEVNDFLSQYTTEEVLDFAQDHFSNMPEKQTASIARTIVDQTRSIADNPASILGEYEGMGLEDIPEEKYDFMSEEDYATFKGMDDAEASTYFVDKYLPDMAKNAPLLFKVKFMN